MNSKNIKPIFLISLPRSGSTLLQRTLAGHSKIDTTAEAWLLLPFVYAYKDRGIKTEYTHRFSYKGVRGLIDSLPGKLNEYHRHLADFTRGLY